MVAVNNFGASQAAQFREQAITVERNQHNVRTAELKLLTNFIMLNK